jgi:murein L,D-transpeptidase YcbB/YkuD
LRRTFIPIAEIEVDAEEALWQRVQEQWDDEKRHQAFLAFCQNAQTLGLAAKRYREVTKDEEQPEGKRELAEKKLQAITALALAQIAAAERTNDNSADVKRGIRLVAALLLGAALLAMGWAFTR